MDQKILIIAAVVVVVVIVAALFLLTGKEEAKPVTGGKLSADQVDIIPAIPYTQCMTDISETNPEMSAQDAKDNCQTIDAVTKADSSLCNEIVNPAIKESCLAQF